MNNRPGLTLLEVLAATALLTLVASAGLTLTRQTTRSQHAAMEATIATEAVRAWSQEVTPEPLPGALNGSDASPYGAGWTYRDSQGRHWRTALRIVELPPDRSPVASQGHPAPAESWRWIEVTFERQEHDSDRYRAVASLVRTVRADRPWSGAPQ